MGDRQAGRSASGGFRCVEIGTTIKQGSEFKRRHGAAEQEALRKLAALFAQPSQFVLGFDVICSVWARPRMARMMAAASGLLVRSRTKERSILILSKGKLDR